MKITITERAFIPANELNSYDAAIKGIMDCTTQASFRIGDQILDDLSDDGFGVYRVNGTCTSTRNEHGIEVENRFRLENVTDDYMRGEVAYTQLSRLRDTWYYKMAMNHQKWYYALWQFACHPLHVIQECVDFGEV